LLPWEKVRATVEAPEGHENNQAGTTGENTFEGFNGHDARSASSRANLRGKLRKPAAGSRCNTEPPKERRREEGEETSMKNSVAKNTQGDRTTGYLLREIKAPPGCTTKGREK